MVNGEHALKLYVATIIAKLPGTTLLCGGGGTTDNY